MSDAEAVAFVVAMLRGVTASSLATLPDDARGRLIAARDALLKARGRKRVADAVASARAEVLALIGK